MNEKKPTHMLIPIGAFATFDRIADLALRQGGIQAMDLVTRFTSSAKPYTPEMPKALARAMANRGAGLVAATPPADNEPPDEGETGTEG